MIIFEKDGKRYVGIECESIECNHLIKGLYHASGSMRDDADLFLDTLRGVLKMLDAHKISYDALYPRGYL
jgi:hypothetical protein